MRRFTLIFVISILILASCCLIEQCGSSKPPSYRTIQYKKQDGVSLQFFGTNTDEPEAFGDAWQWSIILENTNLTVQAPLFEGYFGYHADKNHVDSPADNWFSFRIWEVIEYEDVNGQDGYQQDQDFLVNVWNEEFRFDWDDGKVNGWIRDNGIGDDNIQTLRFHAHTDTDVASEGQFKMTARSAPANTEIDDIDLTPNEVEIEYMIENFPWLSDRLGSETSKLAFRFEIQTKNSFELPPGAATDMTYFRVLDPNTDGSLPEHEYAVNLEYFWNNLVVGQFYGDGNTWREIPVHMGEIERVTDEIHGDRHFWWYSFLSNTHYDIYKWDPYTLVDYQPLVEQQQSAASHISSTFFFFAIIFFLQMIF
mmetsp:Transcript_17283/g.25717  ORF Transcript_17283/g.25717 Transcript_17283/m.25717 type:complete len:366 (+) Transcript_17283:1423-2520(+)